MLEDVDIYSILISKNASFDKRKYKYFINRI